MELVIGRIGRAHGVRGEVSVDVRTDQPAERFAVGGVVTGREPDSSGAGDVHLTIETMRWHSSRLLLSFEGIADRTCAESLRGLLLVVEVAADERTDDPDDFYDHQLVGLAVQQRDGVVVGTVGEVVHLPMQDLLAVRRADGDEVLVPFVRDIVPEVDLSGRRVIIEPPAGLLDGE